MKWRIKKENAEIWKEGKEGQVKGKSVKNKRNDDWHHAQYRRVCFNVYFKTVSFIFREAAQLSVGLSLLSNFPSFLPHMKCRVRRQLVTVELTAQVLNKGSCISQLWAVSCIKGLVGIHVAYGRMYLT